jgi:hypothetical protein
MNGATEHIRYVECGSEEEYRDYEVMASRYNISLALRIVICLPG